MPADRLRRAYALAVWAQLALTAASARAQRLEQPALHWSRGPAAFSCIDPRSLAQRVEDLTGPTLVAAGAADVSIEARIDQSGPERYTVRIRLTRGREPNGGERLLSFKAADCRSLDAAIALVIAVLIDPDAGSRLPDELSWLRPAERSAAEQLRDEVAASQPSVIDTPKLAAPSTTLATAAPVRPRPAATLAQLGPRWQLSLGVASGTGPSSAAHLGVLAALQRALTTWLGVGLQLRAASALTDLRLDGVHSLSMQSAGLAVLVCPTAALDASWRAQGCIGPELALLHARGVGFAHDETALLTSFGGSARLAVAHRLLARWWLVALGLVQWDARPPRLHSQNSSQAIDVFDAQPLALQGAIALTYEF